MAAPSAPKICVGLAGPSGVGKSSLLKALLDNEFDLKSGAQHCKETEDLEFEHANIFKCTSADDTPRATCYRSSGHQADMKHIACGTIEHQQERFSLSGRAVFVDCPGNLFHVSTMLKGVMMADEVLILSQPAYGFEASPIVDALAAAHLMGKSITLVQIIKSDEDKKALKGHLKEINRCKDHLNISTDVRTVEVRTSSALKGIGALCGELVIRMMSQPRGELAASSSSSGAPAAFMLIARSSVVDPVGEVEIDAAAAAEAAGDAIVFGTIIGRVMQGIVSVGDEVEIRPGLVRVDDGDDGKVVWCPMKLKVMSVLAVRHNSEDEEENAEGNGLVALRASATIINAYKNAQRGKHHHLVRLVLGGDGGMGGHVLGHAGSLPHVYDALKMEVLLIPRMCDPYSGEVYEPLPPVEAGEKLMLIIGTMSTCGTVTRVKEEVGRKKDKRTSIVVTGLSPPTCARHCESILICRQFRLSWHLIGSGRVLAGAELDQKAL